ncbi:50S ribosomal protein L3 [Candidatus Oleimmundimicrobium sp.]|uniref:50S ribosomal protein L3 n=1 Tax=Candidatus Oleimmundimicrobium sp. TaxID=3060597 RepID=UPI0027277BEE|nr:50S ribosomal protein L3 [Candidatus Oleimmundimicrobium sp.]MDO8886062.1 50S ribosomal protein L3 [Candidatus Oleimmundimicrobium sp.]
MSKGILGIKIGMTQIFNQDGRVIPATVIEAGPCVVTQMKSCDKDGYNAVQIGCGDIKENKVNKPLKGHFDKSKVGYKRYLAELRLDKNESFELGQSITVDIFSEGEKTDVVGISKGKGFAGVVKRWGFGGGPASHGSHFHRSTGSIGMCATPSRVLKGRKFPGRMGGKRVTTQNLEVVKVDKERNLLLLKGSVPGANGDLVLIKNAVKESSK